ncbi:hypothetical protein Tco_0585268 [Tanacetum coccineum]
MEEKKLKDLKNKSFDSIQKMFDRAFKRVNTFVDFRTDLVEDTAELQSLMEVIPDEEEIAIDVVPLATNQMHKSFDREDLEDLYKLVKARYGSTRPVESKDYLLWNDLKTMFEPHVEDAIWRNQQGYKVLEWKLYNSCRVHSLMMQSMQIYMLVEKRYPLTPPTITDMLNKKLQYKVNAAEGVNAASEEVCTAECQETMGDTIAQTRFEHVSKLSNDSLLANLQQRVLDLEKTKTTQQNEIASLNRRVKKLEQKKRSRTLGLKRLHKVSMSRRVVFADNEEILEVAANDVNLTVDEVTLAQALAALKSVKPKVKGDVIKEPNVPVNAASASTKVSTATTKTVTIPTLRKGIVITELGTPTIMRSSQQPSQTEVQDKGKWKMIEPKHVKKMSKKDQLRSDEEEAKRLQAEFDEEERLAREKDEANVALTEEWDDI